MVHPRRNLFSRPRRAGKRAGEKTTGGILGDGTTSSSDGQNFRTGSSGRYAGQVNPKYGQEPGRQFYTHISDQYSPFYTCIISRVRGFNPCSRWPAIPRKRPGNQRALHRYRRFHRSCLCPDASAGVCVLSANQGSPRQKAVYQRESGPVPGASVTDINDQPESERDRNSLA